MPGPEVRIPDLSVTTSVDPVNIYRGARIMQRCCRLACLVLFAMGVGTAVGADWPQFRGPGGLGVSAEKGLPIEWSATKNIVWRTKLPGMGASSPVTLGNRVFVTCYSGYGLENKD